MIFVGKRRRAIARLKIEEGGSGKIIVNSKSLEDYFRNNYLITFIKEPLHLSDNLYEKFDFYVNVKGGGIVGQAEAVRQAIARALAYKSKELEKFFSSYDTHLLTFDSRRNEPHHSSGKGASKRGSRRHKQRSKR
ncbi:MAG: 30S ribosomal protein S9 [Candidatus Aenigmatarchaeota archaeon]